MHAVSVRPVRWVSDEPQPGLVEVELTDADGNRWSFVDKCAIFSADWTEPSHPPSTAGIRCTVVGPIDAPVVTIDTSRPDSVESTDGMSTFRVPLQALSPIDPA